MKTWKIISVVVLVLLVGGIGAIEWRRAGVEQAEMMRQEQERAKAGADHKKDMDDLYARCVAVAPAGSFMARGEWDTFMASKTPKQFDEYVKTVDDLEVNW